MEQVTERDYRIVPGLHDVLASSDEARITEVLSGLQPGERIRMYGMLLEVDESTENERILLERAQKEGREYAAVTVGNTTIEIAGDRGEVDRYKVWERAKELLNSDPSASKRIFSHTHYDSVYSPPSGNDVTIMRHYSEGSKFTCRVISWVPNRVFIFKGTF